MINGSSRTLHSKIDRSVNKIFHTKFSFYEARLVVRADKLIIYVSSQDGCSQGCRMCHLTATKQKKNIDLHHNDIYQQVFDVLKIATEKKISPKKIHINFMARGEPFSNINIIKNLPNITLNLTNMIEGIFPNKPVKFIISTIFPDKFFSEIGDNIFTAKNVYIYYSLYGMDIEFRKKWLPNSISPYIVKNFLEIFHYKTKNAPRLHFCFIEGENDSIKEISDICYYINSFNFQVDVNIVRYNPYDVNFGKESSFDIIARNVDFIKNHTKSNVKIIDRVGFDVKASCGMFLEKNQCL